MKKKFLIAHNYLITFTIALLEGKLFRYFTVNKKNDIITEFGTLRTDFITVPKATYNIPAHLQTSDNNSNWKKPQKDIQKIYNVIEGGPNPISINCVKNENNFFFSHGDGYSCLDEDRCYNKHKFKHSGIEDNSYKKEVIRK